MFLKSPKMINRTTLIFLLTVSLFVISCADGNKTETNSDDKIKVYHDTEFDQEYHEAFYPGKNSKENEINGIAVDDSGNVWAASGAGVFVKKCDSGQWAPVTGIVDKGPAYSVEVDSNGVVWIGTWNGVYSYWNSEFEKAGGIDSPVSVLCVSNEGIYALGPQGIWLNEGNGFIGKNYNTARSFKDAVSDSNGGLWVTTYSGLYHCSDDGVKLYQDTTELISSYSYGLDYSSDGSLWVANMGGVSVINGKKRVKVLKPEEGLPSIFVNTVKRDPEGTMWVGTDVGVVRFYEDGTHSLRFSRRWLTDNKVKDIAFDKDGNAWIATAKGISAIKKREMTLVQKERYFYSNLMRRHIREPWVAGTGRLTVPGDTTSLIPVDDDNDGEYTSIYMSMESLRYAATKDEDAREKARKAFDFLVRLQTITETDGFFARTIVPAEWETVHDGNRTYSEWEIADAMVNDPRSKPMENRWRKSRDGKWLWKGDTSSDEMCGHFMGYFYFYEFAADESDKERVRKHVSNIVDYLIENDYNFIDIDGRHTRWGVWSPSKLNDDQDWLPERYLNSFELLAYLKFVYHITGNEKYQSEYMRLINEENYLDNVSMLNDKNPAWQIYFDITMAGYLYPIFLKYETDPELKKFFENHIDIWFEKQRKDEVPFNNFIYCYSRDKVDEVKSSVDFLIDTPLDLVDWRIDHTIREDIDIVRSPILEELQTSVLIPPSERATVRWDRNPYAAVNGNPNQEREPVFWLFPYWFGRYLGLIQ